MADLFEPAPQSPDARESPESPESRDSPERKRRKPEPRRSVIRLSFKSGLLDPELLRYTPNLAHQVKADPRRKPGGLAKGLEELYPFASLHTEGAKGPQDELLGTVRIDTEPSDPKGQEGHKAANVTIFSLYGQRYGGPPGNRADSSADREAYFARAIADIQRKAPDLKSIAFPENIGCGIGAGIWPNYEQMILDFANDMPSCTVYIVHYGAQP
jgi:hypothetical protein